MNKQREYMDLFTRRKEELNRHDKSVLIAQIVSLESALLYEVYVRGDIGDADCEDYRREILSELNDFIRYHRVKDKVVSRIDRDFASVDPSAREELVNTLTELIVEVSDSV